MRGCLSAILLCALLPAQGAQQSFEAEFRQGLLALQKNDLSQAEESLGRALKLNPESARAWAALADAYARAKKTKQASNAAGRAARFGASDPVVQHSLAIFYSTTGDFLKAADWERRFASGRPRDAGSAARVAVFSLRAGKPQQAIVWARTALGLRDNPEMHHLLGNAYAVSRQPGLAAEEFRNAAERAPDNESFLFDYGDFLLRGGNFEGALAVFSKGRERFPKNPQIELAYGVACYGQRKFEEAIASFLQVTKIDPTIEQPYVFMAKILDHAADRMPEIAAVYSAWEKISPGNYLPPLLHAKALSALPDTAPEAVEVELRKSIALNGASWESHLELGTLLAKKTSWREAAAELSRSIELNPKEPRAHFQLARVYERLGEKAKAKAERALHEQLTSSETMATAPPVSK